MRSFFIKVFIFLCLFSVSANAYTIDVNSTTTYKTDFGIYVYGDIESIENAFILVQAVGKSAELDTILALLVAFFLPFMAYKFFNGGSGRKFSVDMTYLVASLLFINTDGGMPTATIHIEDLRVETKFSGLPAKTYAKIDGIPYPIALVTSTVSTITDSLTNLFEDAVALINPDLTGASTRALGFGGAMVDMLRMIQASSLNNINDASTTQFSRGLTAYVEQCALTHALASNPDLIVNIKSPNKDLFKSIDPTSLGVTGAGYTMTFTTAATGEQTYTCNNFWNNNIINKYDTVATKLLDSMQKQINGDLSSTALLTAYQKIGGTINDPVIATKLGAQKAYMLNAAALAPISNAFANTGIDLSSGQEVANRVTSGASMAEIQMEGAGRMKWLAEMLPYAMHFMLGIIYSISILIMLIATALGAEKGFMIWKNFAKGLMTFEFIKISLVIVNASVNQYASLHAMDYVSAIGANPASLTAIPYHFHYLANMAGIAGILGVSAVFMIPGMIFSGDVAMATGALGAIAGRYKGNDVNTASAVTAEQQAKNDAYERDLKARNMLEHMGIPVPANMSAGDYYSEYKRGAEMSNAALGAHHMGTQSIASAAVATKGQTMQSIQSMSTLASTTTMSEFVSAGVGQGMQMTSQVASMGMYGQNVTAEQARGAGTLQGARMAGATQGEAAALGDFGSGDIMRASKLGAYTQQAEGVKMTEARMGQGLATEDGKLTDLALKSMERKMGMDAAGMAGLGKAEYKDKDGKELTDQQAFELRAKASAGQSAEAPIKDAAYINQAMSGNGLNQQYATGLSVGEEAKLAGVKGLGSLNASDQARYIAASENQGMIKAKQTIGDTEATMQTADKLKKAGESIGDALERVAKDLGSVKVANSFGSAKEIEKRGLDNAINLSQAAGEAKQAGDFETTARQIEKYGSARNAAIINANKQVDDGFASYEADTFKSAHGQMRNDDGTLTDKGLVAKKQSFIGQNVGMLKTSELANSPEMAEAQNQSALAQNAQAYFTQKKGDRTLTAEQAKNLWTEAVLYARSNMQESNLIGKDYTDENGVQHIGKTVTGDDRIAAIASMKAGALFGMQGGVLADGTTVRMQAGELGTRTSVSSMETVEAGKSVSYNETDKTTVGTSTDILTEGKLKSQVMNFKAAHKGEAPKDLKELAEWVQTSEQTEESKNKFFGNLVNTVATYTGADPESAEVGAYLAAVGLGGIALNSAIGNPAGKSFKSWKSGSNNSVPDKSGEPSPDTDNPKPDNGHNNKSTHPKTPLDNIRNYTENHAEKQANLDAESRTLQGLEEQRANLKDGDPRASKLDNQIAESKSKVSALTEATSELGVNNRNIAGTQHLVDMERNPRTGSVTDELAANRRAAGILDDIEDTGESLNHGGNRFTRAAGKALSWGSKGAGAVMAYVAASSLLPEEAEAKELPSLPKATPSAAANVVAPVEKSAIDNALDAATSSEMAIGGLALAGSKMAARVLPGVAVGVGAIDAANRTSNGDYLGAAMSAAAAATANIPGIGTVASLAIVGAQMATDALGVTGQPEAKAHESVKPAEAPKGAEAPKAPESVKDTRNVESPDVKPDTTAPEKPTLHDKVEGAKAPMGAEAPKAPESVKDTRNVESPDVKPDTTAPEKPTLHDKVEGAKAPMGAEAPKAPESVKDTRNVESPDVKPSTPSQEAPKEHEMAKPAEAPKGAEAPKAPESIGAKNDTKFNSTAPQVTEPKISEPSSGPNHEGTQGAEGPKHETMPITNAQTTTNTSPRAQGAPIVAPGNSAQAVTVTSDNNAVAPVIQQVVQTVQQVNAPVQQVNAPVQQVNAPVQQMAPEVAPLTMQAMRNDPELPAAIDAYNASQNMQSISNSDNNAVAPVIQQVVQTVQQVNAPVQQVNAPVQQVNAPVQQVNAPVQQVNAPVQQMAPEVAPLTMQAMRNDPELPAAIDAYNASQNMQSISNFDPSRTMTMQSRGGEIAFAENRGTGNLMVQFPDQGFPVKTGVPFGQFKSAMSDPAQAQQFAQAVTQSNLDGDASASIQQAQNFEQLKYEMSSGFTQNNLRNMQLGSQMGNTRMMLEEIGNTVQEDFAQQLSNLSEDLVSINKKLEGI